MKRKSRNFKKNKINYIILFFIIVIIVLLIIWKLSKNSRENFEKNQENDKKVHELKEKFRNFFEIDKYKKKYSKNFNENFLDTINIYKSIEKTYSLNKKDIYICLFDEDDKYYDDNMLIYALAHEIGHCLCDSIGHTDEYWNIFKDLLKDLESENIYNSAGKIPDTNYCSHKKQLF